MSKKQNNNKNLNILHIITTISYFQKIQNSKQTNKKHNKNQNNKHTKLTTNQKIFKKINVYLEPMTYDIQTHKATYLIAFLVTVLNMGQFSICFIKSLKCINLNLDITVKFKMINLNF